MNGIRIPDWLVPDSEHAGVVLVRIALTVVAAWIVQRLAFLVVGRLERWLVLATHEQEQAVPRARTLGQIGRNLVTTLVAGWAIVHALEVLGWDVKPLLVGASILGAALGFGAQWLVRDTIAGAFILIENQFAVGDTIEVGGQVGTVEQITLRSTRLRDFQGRVLFVPNGEMKVVINHDRDWRRQLVDVPIAPDQDLDRALQVAAAVAARLNAEGEWRSRLLDPVEVPGIERVGPEGTVLRLQARTRPGADGPLVARELRLRLLQRLTEAGVRSGASREITLAPPAPGGGGPA
jgi:small conductance mechanosensitive channel